MSKRVKKTDINGWNEEEERILKDWSEIATCYHWLHSNSHEKYYKINLLFAIPVIVISTVTGTANFAIERLDEQSKSVASMIIGAFNIIAAIISTVAQFLRISEINEGHRIATINWDKFARNIKIELGKNPIDRKSASDMIRIYKEEFDRLIEISPKLKQNVINDFNKTFKDIKMCKPEITGYIKETEIFDRKKLEWEVEENKSINIKEEIEKFKRIYFESNGRFPSNTEISNHFPSHNILFDENGDIASNLISISIDSTQSIYNELDDK